MDFDIGDLVDSAEGAIYDAVDAISDAVDDVEDAVDAISDAVDDVEDAVGDVEDAVDDIENGDVEDALDDVEDAVDDVEDAVDDVEDAVDDVEDAVDDVEDAVDDVEDAVLGATSSIADACEDWASEAEETFTEDYKLVVGAFIRAEELQEQSDELTQEGYNQLAYDFVSSYEQAGTAQEEANRNEYNKIVADEEELENLQKQSDEMIKQNNAEEADYIKNMFNNAENELPNLDNKHFIVGGGGSAAATVLGGKEGNSTAGEWDLNNDETDVLNTSDVGMATNLSGGIGGFLQVTVADNGIPDMKGESDTTGFTLGFVSVDVSKSANATSYTLNLGAHGVEGHKTKSYTISGKDTCNQLNEFGNEYMQYEQDKFTDQMNQQTNQDSDQQNQMSDQDKTKQDIANEPFKELDHALGADK